MEQSNYLGWIKVWRKLASDSMWLEERFTRGQAWVDLLLLAQGLDRTEYYDGQFAHFAAGTVYKSIVWLAKRWGWNRKTVEAFLKQLEAGGRIKVSSHKRIGTTIQVLNWGVYQKREGNIPNQTGMGNGTFREKSGHLETLAPQGLEADFEGVAGHMTGHMTGHNKEEEENKEIIYYAPFETQSATPSAPLLKGGSGEASESGRDRIPAEWRDSFESYEEYWRWRNQ